jgi:hypothetical protein
LTLQDNRAVTRASSALFFNLNINKIINININIYTLITHVATLTHTNMHSHDYKRVGKQYRVYDRRSGADH